MKVLKCYEEKPWEYYLSKNKLYEYINEDSLFYELFDDNGKRIWMYKSVFTDITRNIKLKLLK